MTNDELKQRLAHPDLSVYTVVRMAQIDLQRNDVPSAMARLRIDYDKIRCVDSQLADWIYQYFKS